MKRIKVYTHVRNRKNSACVKLIFKAPMTHMLNDDCINLNQLFFLRKRVGK